MALSMSDYQVPSFLKVLGQEKGIEELSLGRLKEILQTGQAFIESEPAYQEIERSMDILSFDTSPQKLSGYSTVSVNRIRRNFRDLVATISNLRPTGMALTKKSDADRSVWRLNQMKQHWWNATFQDRKYREACQYASGLGTGYLSPWWDNNFYGHGRGEIAVKVYGPSSVFPVMMTEDYDLQKAYAVTICEDVPLHIVLANYPDKAHLITPTSTFPGWVKRAWDRMNRSRQKNGVLGVLDTPQKTSGREMPMVKVYTTYTMDETVNNTRQEILMGDPGTSWSYKVPFLGQEIPSGIRDIRGNMISKRADMDDCRLFPMRRRSIWTDTCTLKDNTSPYLHGRVPLVQLRFDDAPWNFLGNGIIHDTWKIQKAINQLLRIMVDSGIVRMQPPLTYDPNVIDPAAFARINTRQPAQSVQMGLGMGTPIQPLLPVAFYDVPQWMMALVTYLGEQIDNLSVVKDLMAVAKAKQVPSADSIEKILEAAGPIVQDIARGGEKATCEFDGLFYPLALQFWGADKVFHILGEDGAVKEAIDYDPGNLIPSHLPGEDTKQDSIYDKWERVRWTIEQLSYVIEPYSQAQVSRIGRNLVLLQAYKLGLPVGVWNILKNMGLNPGEPKYEGEVATNDFEEFLLWKKISADLAAELQQKTQGQAGPGRPNVNTRPPQVKQKDQGTRSTIATSR